MFQNGDIVKIKEAYRSPSESDLLYRVVNVNEATKRCYIELAACNLPLSPQELVGFDMIEPYSENVIPVLYTDRGILLDSTGNEYFCDADGYGHVRSSTTGEMFDISKRDEHENPIAIIPMTRLEA